MSSKKEKYLESLVDFYEDREEKGRQGEEVDSVTVGGYKVTTTRLDNGNIGLSWQKVDELTEEDKIKNAVKEGVKEGLSEFFDEMEFEIKRNI